MSKRKKLRLNSDEYTLLFAIIFSIIGLLLYFGYTLPYEVREKEIALKTPIPQYYLNQKLKPHDYIYGLHLDFFVLSVALMVSFLDARIFKIKFRDIPKMIKNEIKKRRGFIPRC